MPAAPVGASPKGASKALPKTVTFCVRRETSTSVRGTSLMRSKAARFSRRVTLSSAPGSR